MRSAFALAYKFVNIEEIWVAKGTNRPSNMGDRLLSFTMKDTMNVYGGFAGTETMRSERDPSINPVALDGDIGITGDSTDNSFHVVTIDSSCLDCILDGVTVAWGLANGGAFNNQMGAGAMSYGAVTLTATTIEKNTSTAGGAAIYNTGPLAQLIIDNCIIRLNTSAIHQDVIQCDIVQS